MSIDTVKSTDVLLTIFNGLLVVVTGYLVIYTRKLWASTQALVIGGQDTAKKELRAYLGIERAYIRMAFNKDTVRGEIDIRNTGKTVAKEVEVWFEGVFEGGFGNPQKTDFDLTARKGKSVLMPNGIWRFHKDIKGSFQIEVEPYAIFMWGRIKYNDVFGEPHWTIFRFFNYKREIVYSTTGDAIILDGWDVQHCDDGNDAT